MEEQDYKTPKALMAAVVGMGVLIIVGVVVLVGVVIHRMNAPHQPALASAIPLTDARNAHLALGPDEHMLAITRVHDDLLAIQIASKEHERIMLWNVATGQVQPGLETTQP
ncbi:DUF6476 family protein [Acetobacter fabarum]|jgi:hypothetical protein|uniref:DUF6476 family protein n=1 Tax=Acetobacter fabarum TaxID=483199 RepID=UPI0033A0C0A0|nr:hypothetical protein [Acetobacter fabarum]MCI1910175.1 hypothetical protein [Acetobacter fabarum]MCI1928673.1 hypothetical protein [Acetobacter fabarum]MCI1948695.1 hypothetical protein [Acetobacter fabarum]MCI1989680.1 hypothetical protein [Acetobacter fabarum]